jgi:hypothetical protein
VRIIKHLKTFISCIAKLHSNKKTPIFRSKFTVHLQFHSSFPSQIVCQRKEETNRQKEKEERKSTLSVSLSKKSVVISLARECNRKQKKEKHFFVFHPSSLARECDRKQSDIGVVQQKIEIRRRRSTTSPTLTTLATTATSRKTSRSTTRLRRTSTGP